MTTAQRIEKIEEFVHMQRYLHGVPFRVVEDPDTTDGFIIELDKPTERQLATLRHRLRLQEMLHIRCRPLNPEDVVKYETSKKRKKKPKR